ncbi:hypothetical protein [Pseudomonas phage PseuP_222]|nr:hypothetical protein [Pseudomonas phage PseuP_222]
MRSVSAVTRYQKSKSPYPHTTVPKMIAQNAALRHQTSFLTCI